MAANVEDAASADSEAYIEKYLRSVLAVENILTLDRLRQVWLRAAAGSALRTVGAVQTSSRVHTNCQTTPKTTPVHTSASQNLWQRSREAGMSSLSSSTDGAGSSLFRAQFWDAWFGFKAVHCWFWFRKRSCVALTFAF